MSAGCTIAGMSPIEWPHHEENIITTEEATNWPTRIRNIGFAVLGVTAVVDAASVALGLSGEGLGIGSVSAIFAGAYLAFMGVVVDALPDIPSNP